MTSIATDGSRMAAPFVALLLLTAACGTPSRDEPEDQADTEAATDATEPDPSTAGETDGEAASDGGPTDGEGETETAGETEGETEGEIDAACEGEDPETDSMVVVDWAPWAEPLDVGPYSVAIDIEQTCLVLAVDPTADPVATVLECEHDGMPRELSFSVPAADAPVAWSEGELVDVAFHHYEWDFEYGIYRSDLGLWRNADGALLLASMNQEELFEDTFSPLLPSVDEFRCGPPGAGPGTLDTWNMVVTFDNGVGETVEVGHQQQGTLTPTTGEGILAIDVGEARYGEDYCCHALRGLQVLVRRTTGG